MVYHECVDSRSRVYDFSICYDGRNFSVKESKLIQHWCLQHILYSDYRKVGSDDSKTDQEENQNQMGIEQNLGKVKQLITFHLT